MHRALYLIRGEKPKAAVKAEPAACCGAPELQRWLVMGAEVCSFFLSLHLNVLYSAESLSYVNYLLRWII